LDILKNIIYKTLKRENLI